MSIHSLHHLTRTPASSLVFFQVLIVKMNFWEWSHCRCTIESPPSRLSAFLYWRLGIQPHSAKLPKGAEIGPNYLSKKKLCQRIYVYSGIPKMEDFTYRAVQNAPSVHLETRRNVLKVSRRPATVKSHSLSTTDTTGMWRSIRKIVRS